MFLTIARIIEVRIGSNVRLPADQQMSAHDRRSGPRSYVAVVPIAVHRALRLYRFLRLADTSTLARSRPVTSRTGAPVARAGPLLLVRSRTVRDFIFPVCSAFLPRSEGGSGRANHFAP